MDFTKDDVEKLASLSRLALTEAEKDNFAKEIGGILAYVGQIQKVADGADIVSHRTDKAMYPMRNVLRDDITDKGTGEELNPDEEILINSAPRHTDQYIQVKKIIGGSQ